MALGAGTRLGVYEIIGTLGAAGMGEVYRARDTRLDRIVAVKILRPDLARDIGSRERLEAVEQVCGPGAGDTIELLSHLIDKSLIVVDEDAAEGRRYHLLETVRQYARDRLFESGEAATLRDRHFRFFYRLALDAKPELPGPNQEASVRQLNADHDNLRAALEWCLTTPGNTEASLRMVGALWRFWIRRSFFGEGRQWVERALATGSDEPRSLRARALRRVRAGMCRGPRGVKAFPETGRPAGMTWGLIPLASAAAAQKQFSRAARLWGPLKASVNPSRRSCHQSFGGPRTLICRRCGSR